MADRTPEEIIKITDALANKTMTAEEATKAMTKLTKSLKETSTESVKATAAQMELAKTFGDTIGQLDSARTLLKDYETLNAQSVLTTEAKTEAERQAIEMQRAQIAALKDAADAAKDYIEEIEAMGPGYEEALRKGQPFFEDMATKMGLLSKGSNKFLKQIYELGSAAGKKGGLKGLAQGFRNVFNAANLGLSIISKIAQATIAQAAAVDKAGAAYAKSTGFGREFDGMLSATNDSMKRFNVNAEDVGKGLVSLRTGLSQFKDLTAETQQNLLNTVVGLEKLGVATDDSTQVLNNMTKALGMSESKAADLTREIALSGKALGMTASKITKEFNSALGTLAVYGDKSTKVFMKMAAMAQSAGVEVGDLLNIANKFDTFSDAAQTAAKMNAILGTSFSGVNMMMMDHGQRVEEVIKGMQKTGKSFGQLDKFTQQAIAAQLGIKDMAKANKILGMSLGGYRKMQRVQAQSKKDQEALNEKMKDAMSIVDKLKQIMMAFAIDVQPIIPFIKKAAESFAGFLNLIKDVHPLLLLFGSAIMFLTGKGLIAAGMIKLMGKAASSAAPGVAALGGSMGLVGLSMIGVGIGVALIVGSFALLVKTLFNGVVALAEAGVGFAQAAGGAMLFAGAILATAAAIKILSAATLSLSVAGPIGLIIGGVLAAGFGLSKLLSSDSGGAEPFDSKGLMDNADKITVLSTKLKELTDNKEGLQSTFAAIGAGLEIAKNSLNADIQSTLANVALITTGQAAGEMSRGGFGEAISKRLGEVADAVGGFVTGKEDKKKMLITLDPTATKNLLSGQVAQAWVTTGS